MGNILTKPIRNIVGYVVLGILAATIAGFAQDQTGGQPAPGWHRFSGPPPAAQTQQPAPAAPTAQLAPQPDQPLPSRLTLQPGTYISVRVDQYLSSDKNHAGDGFSASLTRPLVVDGVIVARRGEIVGGRVVDAKKAGRIKGVSHLTLRLSDLTLADGTQAPIQTAMAGETGPTSKGRDAAALATTTAAGAAIGSAADWGTGAAIGAGAGAVAGTVGVLLTRGRATVVYPETTLTFRLAAPVVISTERAPQAFSYVDNGSYDRTASGEQPPRLSGRPAPYPPSYFYSPYYDYPYPYWGPSFSFWYGRGFRSGWGHGYRR